MLAASPVSSLLLWLHALPAAHAAAPDARFALALYCDPVCDDAVLDALEQDLASIPAVNGFEAVARAPGRLMGMASTASDGSRDGFAVPDADFIASYGVDVDRPEALSASEEVVLAWFAAPPGDAAAVRQAARVALTHAAASAHGWVEDLDTQRVYGSAAWAALDEDGPLEDWFVVEGTDADEGAARLVTRGLRRFAEAELVMQDIAEADAPDAARVLNAVAAALHGRTEPAGQVELDADGVRGTAVLSEILPLDGDPDAPLLAVRFSGQLDADQPSPARAEDPPPVADAPLEATAASSPGSSGSPSSAATAAGAPAATWSAASPPTASPTAPARPVSASPPPTTADAARAAMRARFDGHVRAAFQAGLPPGGKLAVCVPFPNPDGSREFLWIEVTAWQGDTLSGTVVSTPTRTRAVTRGQRTDTTAAAVFDYLLRNPDGSREGNTMAAVVNDTRSP